MIPNTNQAMPAAPPPGETLSVDSAVPLLAAGAVTRVTLRGQLGGFAVVLRIGEAERRIGTRGGVIRLFSGVAAAANFLQELGVRRYCVDVGGHARRPRARAARARPAQRVARPGVARVRLRDLAQHRTGATHGLAAPAQSSGGWQESRTIK